jgi:tetratricopeptide (TPR) repeat protein
MAFLGLVLGTEGVSICLAADTAKAAFLKAAEIAVTIEEAELRDRVLHSLANRQALAGMTTDALNIAQRIENTQLKIYGHLAVARRQVKDGSLDLARRTGELARQVALAHDGGKGYCDSNLVTWLVQSGMTKEAIDYGKAVSTAQPNPDISFCLQMVCSAILREGRTELALKVMREEIPQPQHSSALWMMAGHTAELKLHKLTERLASMMTDVSLRDRTYLRLVQALALDEDVKPEELQRLAAKITDVPQRHQAEAYAVKVETVDDISGLRRRLVQETDRKVKLTLLRELFASHIKQKQAAEAVAVIEDVEALVDKHPAAPDRSKFGVVDDATLKLLTRIDYAQVAEIYREQDDEENALRCRQLAMEAAKALPDSAGLGKVFALSRLSQMFQQAGQTDALERLGEVGQSSMFGGMAVGSLATRLVEAGKLEEAIAAIKKERQQANGYWRGQAVSAVIPVLVKAGKAAEIPRFLEAIGETDEDYQAYATAAEALTRSHDTELLDRWLADWPSAGKAYGYMGIAAAHLHGSAAVASSTTAAGQTCGPCAIPDER